MGGPSLFVVFVCSFIDLKTCKININSCRSPENVKLALLDSCDLDLLSKNVILLVAVTII